MAPPLAACVLLGLALSVRAASLPLAAEDFTDFTTMTTTASTTTPPNTSDLPFTTPHSPEPPFTTPDLPYTSPYTSDQMFTSQPYLNVTQTENSTTPQTTPPNTSDPPFTTPYTTRPPATVTCCMTTPPSTSQTPPSPTQNQTPPSPTQNQNQNPPSPSQIMCPDGWEVFQGGCYYFVNEGLTWPQAQTNCAMMGSMLASVHSAQEYAFLQQLTNNNGNQQAWLGGFYLQNQWLWIDGSWFYNIWSWESPDSSNPCLLLSSNEAWSNSPCIPDGYASICVKSSNVPPEMLCPQGWTGFQGRCYYYNTENLAWPDADVNCAGLGASLVSVHSPEEYTFLYQQTAVNGFSPTWLGGFYLDDQWMWLDGSWFYQGFSTQMSPGSTNSCLSTYHANGWSNFGCDQSFASFCVKNAVL